MKLGAYTLPWDPSEFFPPVPIKRQSHVNTYAGVAYFSWGVDIVGKEILLEWDFMTAAQFASLQALYEADAPVLWDPEVSGVSTYTVEITEFDGRLFEDVGFDKAYRKSVKMKLLILEEFPAGS